MGTIEFSNEMHFSRLPTNDSCGLSLWNFDRLIAQIVSNKMFYKKNQPKNRLDLVSWIYCLRFLRRLTAVMILFSHRVKK